MTKKEKVWSIICTIGVIVGLLGYFGIQPYWTKPDTIDSKALAKQLAKNLPDHKDLAAKDEKIKQLENTIERLQKDSADKLKQQALQALKEDDTEKAVELLEKSALSRTEKLTAQNWIDIGNIAYLNDSQKALNAYKKATDLDPSNPVSWNQLGLIQNRLGHSDKAQYAYEKVLELSGIDKKIQASAYGNLGILYLNHGDLDKAEEFTLKALDINNSLGRQKGMATAYGNLGIIYKTNGDLNNAEGFYDDAEEFYDDAEKLFLKALAIDENLGRQKGMANAYGSLAIIYKKRDKINKAEEYYLKALEIYKNLGRRESMGRVYANLGIIYKTDGQLDKAEKYYMLSLGIAEKLSWKKGMANAYASLGLLYRNRGDLDKACEYWQKSLQLYTDMGLKSNINKVSRWIAENCNQKI